MVKVGPEQSFVAADIPGLIEGASEGIGLGHDFLRHVERCRLLLHVVDVSGCEGRDPVEDFEKINTELQSFSPELATRPQIVLGNKCDIATEEQIESFKSYVESKGLTFMPISAATNQGLKNLPGIVWDRLQQLPPVQVFEPDFVPYAVNPNERTYTCLLYTSVLDGCCCFLFTGETEQPEKVRGMLLEEIERLRKECVDEELFTLCKNQSYGEMLQDLENMEDSATALAGSFFRKRSLTEEIEALASVTRQEVDEALQTMLRPERSSTVIIWPKQEENA